MGDVYRDYQSSISIQHARLSRTLVVLLLYTALPPGRGREYREMELRVSNGPPRGLQDRTNVFHHNISTGTSHMIVGDHKTSSSKPPQVVQCPTNRLFVDVVHDYVEKQRKLLEPPVGQPNRHLILVN